MSAFRGLLACVLLGAILAESKEQTQPTADSSNSGCANFAGELYNRVRDSLQERNDFVISPVGVSSLLGTLLFAVNQTSESEIANFLYPTCASSREDAPRPLNLNRQASQLTMVTAALVRLGTTVDKRFEEQSAALGSYVFKTRFVSYHDNFDRFVFNKTNDKSFKGFDANFRDRPSSFTRLVFYNRLRYRAQFEQKFTLVDGQLVARRVQALHAHVPELEARVLGLPLLNTASFLLILVPEQGSDLRSVERRLREVDVRKLPSKLNTTTMDITLQRIIASKYIYLRDALKKSGITTVFNKTTADLSAFNGNMTLDNALVATEIDLNENGIGTLSTDFNKQSVVQKATSGESLKFKALGPIIYAVVDSERVYLMGRSFGR